MTAQTPIASTVPEPHGRPGGPGAFGIRGAMFPPYIQHVAGELLKKGASKSRAYQLAIGIVRNWSHGHDGHGHRVSADVQAAARKAIAAYDALRARAKAIPNKGTNLAPPDPASPWSRFPGYDQGGVLNLASERQVTVNANTKKPKLGTGKRFQTLKAELARRGAKNPGALAAYIGRKKLGAKKMAALAAKKRTAS